MVEEGSALAFSTVFLARSPVPDERSGQLAEWGRGCHNAGMVREAEGNLSFRTRTGFVISGTGVALNALTAQTVSEVTGVVYGLNRTTVFVNGMVVPSRETVLHARIYNERPQVNAVFHVHGAQAMRAAEVLGLPVTETERPPGSLQLADEAVRLIESREDVRCFVLRNHGIVALGASMDEAGALLQQLHAS